MIFENITEIPWPTSTCGYNENMEPL